MRRALSVVRYPLSVVGAMVTVLLALPGAARAQDEVGLPIGTTAKAVTVEDLDGKPVDLAQFIGKKPVLMEFWATWCPLCRALEPRMVAAKQKLGDQVEFIAVAVAVNQTKASIKRHLSQHPLPLTVLWDTNGNAVRAFQAPSTSYIVVLDAAGVVRYTGLGEDQDIEKAVEAVRR